MKNNTKLVENSSDFSLDSGKILSRLVNFRYYDTVVQIFRYIAANTAGFALGVYINYTLSTIFVFRGQSTKTWTEFIIFTIIGLVGLAVSNITLYLTIDIMGLGGGISKIIAICSAFFWNFFARKFLLFNGKK